MFLHRVDIWRGTVRRMLILFRSLRVPSYDDFLLSSRSGHRVHLVATRVVVYVDVTISIIGKRVHDDIIEPRVIIGVLTLLLDDFVHDVVNLRFRQHLQIFIDAVT